MRDFGALLRVFVLWNVTIHSQLYSEQHSIGSVENLVHGELSPILEHGCYVWFSIPVFLLDICQIFHIKFFRDVWMFFLKYLCRTHIEISIKRLNIHISTVTFFKWTYFTEQAKVLQSNFVFRTLIHTKTWCDVLIMDIIILKFLTLEHYLM